MKPSRAEILSQLLIVRLEDCRWSAARERFLRAAQPAGVLLPAPLPPTAEATQELLHKIAPVLPQPSFLAVRQEGGPRDPLRRFLPGLPSPRGAAQRSLSAVARLGDLIGEALSLLGFNTNFAPVLDLATPFTEEALGTYTFGSDPAQVAEWGGAFLRGLQRHRILACGKHFPGLGSVANPPGPRVSGKPMAALWREDLLPFRELLPHLPMVLVNPAAYKAYDFNEARPASRSPQIVEGLLRVKLGYRGLAVAYELEAEGVGGTLPVGEAAIQSLNAGCDLLVLDQEASCEIVCRALEEGLESAKLSRPRVEQALARVCTVKRGLATRPGNMSRRALEKLARRIESFAGEFGPEER